MNIFLTAKLNIAVERCNNNGLELGRLKLFAPALSVPVDWLGPSYDRVLFCIRLAY